MLKDLALHTNKCNIIAIWCTMKMKKWSLLFILLYLGLGYEQVKGARRAKPTSTRAKCSLQRSDGLTKESTRATSTRSARDGKL